MPHPPPGFDGSRIGVEPSGFNRTQLGFSVFITVIGIGVGIGIPLYFSAPAPETGATAPETEATTDADGEPSASADTPITAEEIESSLAGCRERVEAIYFDADEHVHISQQVLRFGTKRAASGFVKDTDGDFAPEVLRFSDSWQPRKSVYHGSQSDAEGPYVVLTLVVADASVDKDGDRADNPAYNHAFARHHDMLMNLMSR